MFYKLQSLWGRRLGHGKLAGPSVVTCESQRSVKSQWRCKHRPALEACVGQPSSDIRRRIKTVAFDLLITVLLFMQWPTLYAGLILTFLQRASTWAILFVLFQFLFHFYVLQLSHPNLTAGTRAWKRPLSTSPSGNSHVVDLKEVRCDESPGRSKAAPLTADRKQRAKGGAGR